MDTRIALISVSDKSGLEPFARGLHALGFELLSTGGTARALREWGLPVREVSDYTGFPEILEGRVKTLHPRIHAGLLANLSLEAHRQTLEQLQISPIALVVVNLYPFEQALRAGASEAELIEQIDIGGPTLIRAAAKNFEHVAVVVRPRDYEWVLQRLQSGGLSREERALLASPRVRPCRRIRRTDCELVPPVRPRRRPARNADPHLSAPADPALRGEPPPARGVLHRTLRAPQHDCDRTPDLGQGAFLQQPAGRRSRAGAGARV
ncbi:MAG: hypothetical protein KatS3mg021_1912 [Fimbriimonadales bacterium]|nr:MAG: hypothetical protein KatS3mg021_1912 [Fimbriimonadales bacterium]